ncbi:MAG: prolyl oligopeptidase family serine peptidase, partial [Candidatus Acidiferrales bacterium]
GTDREQILASDLRLDYDGAALSWSPDGSQISFRTGGMEDSFFDCYVVDVEAGTMHNVTNFSSPAASHRKSAIPLWDQKGRIYVIHNGGLWRTSLAEGKAAEVAHIPDREIVQTIPHSGSMLWVAGDTKSTIVLTHDNVGMQDGFYRVDLESGKSTALQERNQCYTCANVSTPLIVTGDGKRVAYFAEDSQHDEDLWISDVTFQNPWRLTHLNPQFDKHKLGAAQPIEWLDDDGEELRGTLLLPAGYRKGVRYPLIVWVYGSSSLSNNLDHFGVAYRGPFNMQLLATRGYAILLPDAPQNLGTPMLDLAKTVLPGVSKVIEMGIADPDRLGVMGHSYGGYSTLSLIVQTKRFKAAVSLDGMGDMVGAYGQMRKDGTAFGTSMEEQGSGLMGDTPWQVRERYVENSPIFYLDRVETPLLIVHGSNDTTVAPFLGDEMFVDLRRLGREVVYAKYEGEGHSPLSWSHGNQVDLCNRMIAWFEAHLKN